MLHNVLSMDEADAALAALSPLKYGGSAEVAWMQMFGGNGRPFGRLKFTQASLDGGLEPIYRYPTNNQAACPTQPWSTTVRFLKDKVEAYIGQTLNHCVGNLYQNEKDFIGPHTDKMLDILEGSSIVSLSLGAARPIVLESKVDGKKQEVMLPHGSLFVIGPKTNEQWTHAIPAQSEKLGHRISLTIRKMGTFFDLAAKRLVGQGSRKPGLNWPEWQHDVRIMPRMVHPPARQLLAEVTASTRCRGSSFHCILRPCSSVEAARASWLELRSLYPEACHIPFAWLIREQQRLAMGSEADGEPVLLRTGLDTGKQGLLEPLKLVGLLDCAVYVVRHWDGEKLGLPNLIQAYSEAVSAAGNTVSEEQWQLVPSTLSSAFAAPQSA